MTKKRIEINLKNITLRELKEALAKLPVIKVGTIAKDHQIIEGNEEGVHYKITKEATPRFPGFTVYMLSVSGDLENRLNITSRFIELLGRPLQEFQIPGLPYIDYVCWNAKEIDQEAVD